MKRVVIAAVAAISVSCLTSLFAAPDAEADLRAALMAYRQALVKKNLPALEKVWTDDYAFIDAHGRVRTKADRLADLRSSATVLDKIDEKPPVIHVRGDIGIIRSDVTITGQYGGKAASGLYRSTHIWIHRDGRWQLLMNQLTAVEK